MSAVHVSQEVWARWESEREAGNRAYAEQRRAQSARRHRDRVDALLDEVERLEARLGLTTVLLESALELLDRRAAAHARTLELVAAVEEIDRLVALDAADGVSAPDTTSAGREAVSQVRKVAAVPEPVFEAYVDTRGAERAA